MSAQLGEGQRQVGGQRRLSLAPAGARAQDNPWIAPIDEALAQQTERGRRLRGSSPSQNISRSS